MIPTVAALVIQPGARADTAARAASMEEVQDRKPDPGSWKKNDESSSEYFRQLLLTGILSHPEELPDFMKRYGYPDDVTMELIVAGAKMLAADLIIEGASPKEAQALVVLDALMTEGLIPDAKSKTGFSKQFEYFWWSAKMQDWDSSTIPNLIQEVLAQQGDEQLSAALYSNLQQVSKSLAKSKSAQNRVAELLPPILATKPALAVRTKTSMATHAEGEAKPE